MIPGLRGCLVSLLTSRYLVNGSGDRRLVFAERAAWHRPNRLLEFAERNFERLFGGAHEVDFHAVEHFLAASLPSRSAHSPKEG